MSSPHRPTPDHEPPDAAALAVPLPRVELVAVPWVSIEERLRAWVLAPAPEQSEAEHNVNQRRYWVQQHAVRERLAVPDRPFIEQAEAA